ncbi:unnamed protein product [Blepharisma stoltei]|uniref:1,4-alpha-glucan branching enzyme n=1 Tax=Blepharisma stoltei TaxID=1481888 RepID=A0AAU9K6V6_9CILI|nr:unnamed protein product [Blepharisma stoltei]
MSNSDHKRQKLRVLLDDPYLENFSSHIKSRYEHYLSKKQEIENTEGSLLQFALGYNIFGIHKTPTGIMYKEWAPDAVLVCLFGDFNNWQRNQYIGKRDQYGVWTIFIPNENNHCPMHGQKLKAGLKLKDGKWVDRIPAWATYCVQDEASKGFDAVFWDPDEPYKWQHPRPETLRALKIYEAHIGMSSEHGIINTYNDFTENVLPKIVETGYNAIQLMAIMEHSYYGSFGYHVTNFFAVSSRYGTPDELKRLVDTAHSYGVYVFLDLIHSHASSNVLDGINRFDGSDHYYFHAGRKGRHELWDSRLFNYKNWETLRFLLSNLRWYIDEYHFDGFRFDGVTSMLYKHHGIRFSFSGDYHEYFNENMVDADAHTYIMLANDLIHKLNPNAITIAEDVSGMPTLGRPIPDGGFGFDYRLNMSVPDKWIKLLKEEKDDHWNMGDIVFTLTNRRWNEKCIAYAESHDQSIVGDNTIAMKLFGPEIYTNMSIETEYTLGIDRGIALHKLIRLITHAMGGEGYLNFMGNEFGHPEWVDFPREGNGWSYHYCRRQWHLRDDPHLYYHYLWEFDRAMNFLEEEVHWLTSDEQYYTVHEKDKIITFERGSRLFVFNFHPTHSFEHYRIGTKWPYEHIIEMDTDERKFYGHGRLQHGHENPFPIMKTSWNGRPNYIQMYLPSRTGIVVKPLINDEERFKYGLKTVQELKEIEAKNEKERSYEALVTATVDILILDEKEEKIRIKTKEIEPKEKAETL